MSDTLINALKLAAEHIDASPHGNDCFLDDGEYNRCFCMKDSISAHLAEVLESAAATSQEPAQAQDTPKAHTDAERKDILLKAAYDLLKKQDRSHYVLNLLTETAHWDEADCDGHCLMTEISELLGLGDK